MDMLEALRKHLEENPNSFVDYMKGIEDNKQRGIDRISRFVNSIQTNDIDFYFDKFLEWEKKFEERKYREGILTSSNVFNAITDYVESVCDRHLNLDEDFLADAFVWRGYTFKLYVGQGSFWKILRNNEHYFTTT